MYSFYDSIRFFLVNESRVSKNRLCIWSDCCYVLKFIFRWWKRKKNTITANFPNKSFGVVCMWKTCGRPPDMKAFANKKYLPWQWHHCAVYCLPVGMFIYIMYHTSKNKSFFKYLYIQIACMRITKINVRKWDFAVSVIFHQGFLTSHYLVHVKEDLIEYFEAILQCFILSENFYFWTVKKMN